NVAAWGVGGSVSAGGGRAAPALDDQVAPVGVQIRERRPLPRRPPDLERLDARRIAEAEVLHQALPREIRRPRVHLARLPARGGPEPQAPPHGVAVRAR